MKFLFGILTFLLVSTSFLNAEETLSTLSFNGITFKKASSSESEAGPFSEYLPKGQTFEDWTKLLGIYQFPKLTNAQAAAEKLAKMIKARNPDAQSEVDEASTSDVAIVDFITWPKDEAYVEFNLWKYCKMADGSLLAIQYAERAYGSDTSEYLEKLGDRRKKLIAVMAEWGF